MNIFEQIQNQMKQQFQQQQESCYLLPTDLNTVLMMLNNLGSLQPDVTKLEGCNVIAVLPAEDLIIYKSRWDEIIENLEWGYGMTDEEAEIVKSVLKNNVPFNVVEISDPIIEKEEQTHLDATHIGDIGNASLYYKSEILKKWFWWNEDNAWVECDFIWTIDNEAQLFPITISKQG